MKSKFLLFLMSNWILFAFYSCDSSKVKSIDKFYTDKGDWDAGRIPFLKPYEAVNVTKKFGWFMNLRGFDGDSGCSNIEEATISNATIFLHCKQTLLHGNEVKQAWYVIIPQKNVEKGFDTIDAYKKYLSKLGIKKIPNFQPIDYIANYFEHNDEIDWNDLNSNQ